MFIADYHLHTNNSDDSVVTMEQYAKYALELGFRELCFTDHVEKAFSSKIVRGESDFYNEYLDVCKEYSDKISLKLGAEFGIQSDNVDFFKKFFKEYSFDFILLSCHTINDFDLFSGTFQEGKTQKEYNEAYYNELFSVINKFDNYSVLAHLDLIRRYDFSYYGIEYTKDIISQILKYIIELNKGIEVNTSCYRYNIPDLTPSIDILKLYKELGGEIITIGSDSHRLNQLGTKIKEVHLMLRDIGFNSFYTFDKMEPIRHDLLKV